jgi:hypothetical protein
MKKTMVLASAAMICGALLSGRAGAQGAPQIVELAKVDVHELSGGYRSSKVASGHSPYSRSAASWVWALTWLWSPMTR